MGRVVYGEVIKVDDGHDLSKKVKIDILVVESGGTGIQVCVIDRCQHQIEVCSSVVRPDIRSLDFRGRETTGVHLCRLSEK